MPIVAKLDELGKPAWIALMVLGFVTWWPLGLTLLAFIIGSGRMSCWKGGGVSRWNAPPLRAAGTWWQPSRLRMAKDKSEFDQFMAERRTRTSPSTSSQDSSSRDS